MLIASLICLNCLDVMCKESGDLAFSITLQMKTSHSGLKGLVIICKPV